MSTFLWNTVDMIVYMLFILSIPIIILMSIEISRRIDERRATRTNN
jgi:hypothetical protein